MAFVRSARPSPGAGASELGGAAAFPTSARSAHAAACLFLLVPPGSTAWLVSGCLPVASLS